MTTIITLPELKVETAVAKQDVRYYLNYPYLDLSGTVPMLVATNGHFLLAARVEIDGDCDSGPLPLEAIKYARKLHPRSSLTLPAIVVDGDMVGAGVSNDYCAWKRPTFDKFAYPDWRSVVPKIEPKAEPTVTVNGSYLDLIEKACPKSRYAGMSIWCGTQNELQRDAIACRTYGMDADDVAVVMPVRSDLKYPGE